MLLSFNGFFIHKFLNKIFMPKKINPTWYFIDFENCTNLPHIKINNQDRLFIFLGQHQKLLHIDFVQKLLDLNKKVLIQLIQISGMGKNNLDFHIAFEMGVQQGIANEYTIFCVISKDKGFDQLINSINEKGRKCKREF